MQPTTESPVCEVCGAHVPELRRGRCSVCYTRWADARPVGRGAACAVCSDRRRDNLRMIEFRNSWYVMCHNCAGKMQRLTPVPRSIEGVRQHLGRDRRWTERRGDKRDNRIFAIERRREDRRLTERDDDGGWIDAADLVIHVSDVPEEGLLEATRIVATEQAQERAQHQAQDQAQDQAQPSS